MARSRDYQEGLLASLQDPREASEYLNAALEEGDLELFLVALRNVADAHGGMSRLAKSTHLNRESLYRTLSEKGNPRVGTLAALLRAMDMRLTVLPLEVPGG
ncbi:MAG: putative addiction module antidote protein [Magnetococcales bacterium]|nr:putative addiction module antidote protein [Magnetococcales bacterium]